MGKNHLYNLVRNMKSNCELLNDKRKIKNHSVRKHLLQKCNDMGVPANCTVQISGHKNIQSVNSYSKMNRHQQKRLSTALMETTGHTSSPTTLQPIPDVTIQDQETSDESSVANIVVEKQTLSPQCSQIFQRQTASSKMSAVFNGTTNITGGVFYFGNMPNECPISQPPTKKFKRIRQIISDSDSDLKPDFYIQ